MSKTEIKDIKETRITAQQIVDDFFHEFTEGRLDREEMIEVIKQYARDCINAYDKNLFNII